MPGKTRKAVRCKSSQAAHRRTSHSRTGSTPLRTLLAKRMSQDGFTSVDQFAAHIGVSRNSLNRALTSDSRPNSRTYQLYADYLGLPSPKVTPKGGDLTAGMRKALATIEQECIHNAFPRLLTRDFDTLCSLVRSPAACARFTKALQQIRSTSEQRPTSESTCISNAMVQALTNFQEACLRRAMPRLSPKAIASLERLAPTRYEILQAKGLLRQPPRR